MAATAERLIIRFESPDLRVLFQMSAADCRSPEDQLRYLLRQEATRRGLLAGKQGKKEESEGVCHEQRSNRA